MRGKTKAKIPIRIYSLKVKSIETKIMFKVTTYCGLDKNNLQDVVLFIKLL